jgi:hypothetical protein
MVGVFLSKPAGLGNTIAAILQFEGLALAGAIIYAIVHPLLFGVSKGERVLLLAPDPISNSLTIRLAVALENGKKHQSIRIAMDGGMEAVATVESYAGILTPARVSIKPENAIKII